MKATKALKRLTHAEDLVSDVIERYSADTPENPPQWLATAGAAEDQRRKE
jgi:hypothetical protein